MADTKQEPEKKVEIAKEEKVEIVDPYQKLLDNVALIEKTVETTESRFVSRVLRSLSTQRKEFTPALLKKFILHNFPDSRGKEELLTWVSSPDDMQVDVPSLPADLLAEIEIYVRLLVTVLLLDARRTAEAVACAGRLISRVKAAVATSHRTSLHLLAAKAYFYYFRAYEVTDRLAEIRSTLLSAYRTACLRHNEEGQATLLNLLLRNYIHYQLYDQTDKFASKTTVTERASANQQARYHYYQGVIKTVQLDYSEAFKNLQQALRKAPQHTALGFRITASKLLVVVQLLMGEIPERALFRQDGFQPLQPYLRLAQAVRLGDLDAFRSLLDEQAALFQRDGNYNFINRLRTNVIKTGLRKICLSYSRISLKDICDRFQLDSVEDAEYIVAKAIRDGVIDALIDHEGGFLQSKESIDTYSTQEPQAVYHSRITFCLDIHNEAVKAMRYPPKKFEVKRRYKRTTLSEAEIAALAEEEEEEF